MLSIVFIFILLFGIVQNALPIYMGYKSTPANQVWLGTIHHPNDYFYYVSQFAQGKESWGPAKNLYTHDFGDATLVGWVNVWMGKFGSILGYEAIQSYHAWVIILTAVFLFAVFLLLQKSVSERQHRLPAAVVSLFLFLVNAPFSRRVAGENGLQQWEPVDYWFNFGNPGQRLGGVPHHLLMHSVLAVIFFLILLYFRSHQSKKQQFITTVLFSFCGVLLGSVQPVHWIMACCVAGLTGVHQLFVIIKQKKAFFSSMHRLFWPAFVIFISGLVPAWQLKQLFTVLPYSQLTQWEFANSVFVPLSTFILATGPVLLLAIFSVFILRLQLFRLPAFVLLSYVCLSLALFFSPLPGLVKLQNVRFLSSLTMVGLSFMGGYALVVLLQRLGRLQWLGIACVLFIVLAVTAPAHWKQFALMQKTGQGNAYIYVDTSVIEAMNQARLISQPDDTFAVMWPYHISFPAVTGRTIYYGHPLLTVNAEQKGGENYHFFSNIKSPAEQLSFLKREGIDFVVAEGWAMDALSIPELRRVYQNQALVIAAVE